jgi:hypothetical protein
MREEERRLGLAIDKLLCWIDEQQYAPISKRNWGAKDDAGQSIDDRVDGLWYESGSGWKAARFGDCQIQVSKNGAVRVWTPNQGGKMVCHWVTLREAKKKQAERGQAASVALAAIGIDE